MNRAEAATAYRAARNDYNAAVEETGISHGDFDARVRERVRDLYDEGRAGAEFTPAQWVEAALDFLCTYLTGWTVRNSLDNGVGDYQYEMESRMAGIDGWT